MLCRFFQLLQVNLPSEDGDGAVMEMLKLIFETQAKHQAQFDKQQAMLERLLLVQNGENFTTDVRAATATKM